MGLYMAHSRGVSDYVTSAAVDGRQLKASQNSTTPPAPTPTNDTTNATAANSTTPVNATAANASSNDTNGSATDTNSTFL